MLRTTDATTMSADTGLAIAVGGAAAFGGLLLGLHLLKPEIEPSWRFISEYALGDFGWMMHVAFVAFAASHVGLFTALRRIANKSWPSRFALAALATSGAGFAVAGLFRTDPVTLDPELATTTGSLHSFGGALGMAMPAAIAFVSWSLTTARPATRKPVWSTAAFALLGALVAMVALGVLLSRSEGRFGPDVPVGWPNRVEIVTYVVWFLTVAAQIRSLPRPEQP